MVDVDIATVGEFCRDLLLGRFLVADQTDDQVLLVCRDLLKEFELSWN